MAENSTYNLLVEPWLPVRRRSGARVWIAPHEITDAVGSDDPIMAPDWGRADFDGATLEFLIALLATACPPAGIEEWADRFLAPPTPQVLEKAFAPLAPAFALDGGGPRFLQDLEDFVGEPVSVSGLFIEAPGANTEKNNADLFQKRGRLTALGRPAAAMALFTLQAWAPSGGAGHRTSVRGGGPLTTLALPPDSDKTGSLWHQVWLNVPDGAMPVPADMARIFAWLAPTRTSEGKASPIGTDDVHPLAALWGMPRRIRLDFESPASAPCSVTGRIEPVTVTSYRTRPWGMNYLPLPHPLSPLYQTKRGSGEWLYLHPQPGGLAYRYWIDIACGDATGEMRRVAAAVSTARRRLRAMRLPRGRIWAAGYDMDNMKARGYVEATFPLFTLGQTRAAATLDDTARHLAAAAVEIASALVRAAMAALHGEGFDKSRYAGLREEFFAETQGGFFAILDALAAVLDTGEEQDDQSEPVVTAGRRFLEETLVPAALAAFDREAPLVARGARDAERIIGARFDLVMLLKGYGKAGAALFGILSLPLPEKKAVKGRRAAG